MCVSVCPCMCKCVCVCVRCSAGSLDGVDMRQMSKGLLRRAGVCEVRAPCLGGPQVRRLPDSDYSHWAVGCRALGLRCTLHSSQTKSCRITKTTFQLWALLTSSHRHSRSETNTYALLNTNTNTNTQTQQTHFALVLYGNCKANFLVSY